MRRLQFAQLTAFVAVARHASFTRAAAHLGVSIPALSQTIRALEEQFDVRLLNRTSRSVALTEPGAELLGHLSPLLEGIDRAEDIVNAFRKEPTGTLRLTVHPVAAMMIVAPLVARFSAENPGIRLEIRVDHDCKDIVGECFDAGIHLADGLAQDMIVVPVGGQLRLRTVASPDYLARTAPVSEPGHLQFHNCVKYGWTDDNTAAWWSFARGKEQVQIAVKGSLTVNDAQLALRAGLDGVGIVQLPEVLVAPHLAAGRLVPVLPDWHPRWSDFVLFYSSQRHVPIKLRALVDFLRDASRPAPIRPRDACLRPPAPQFPSSWSD